MDVLLDRLREWTVGEWVTMLFDTLTAALFVGGCLLLWLNLRRHRRDVRLTQTETAVQTEEEPVNPGLEAGRSKRPHPQMKQPSSMRQMQLH